MTNKWPIIITAFCLFCAVVSVIIINSYWNRTQKTVDSVDYKLTGTVDVAQIGELVILDASESLADDYKWQVLPAPSTYLVIDEGQRLIFSSTKMGTYTFICSTTKDNQVDIKIHHVDIVEIEDWVDPIIVKVPKLEPTDRLIKSWLPQDRTGIEDIANSFDYAIEMNPESIEQLFEITAEQNKLLNNLENWKPFLDRLMIHCKTKFTTLADHTLFWRRVARTLRK